MANLKKRCPECGTFLSINDAGDVYPGCKEREEACCPRCNNVVYSRMTSGFIKVYEITEEQFNNDNDYD